MKQRISSRWWMGFLASAHRAKLYALLVERITRETTIRSATAVSPLRAGPMAVSGAILAVARLAARQTTAGGGEDQTRCYHWQGIRLGRIITGIG